MRPAALVMRDICMNAIFIKRAASKLEEVHKSYNHENSKLFTVLTTGRWCVVKMLGEDKNGWQGFALLQS